jgi:uncharacterized protein (DUF952 family)
MATSSPGDVERASASAIFHITDASSLEAASTTGAYVPPAFKVEGFIHCSYAGQVCAVADRIFRGRRDLVLIEIDRTQLDCAVVEENLEGGSELYPHIYGPLPIAAIRHVHRFPCRADGGFDMPARISYNPTPSRP